MSINDNFSPEVLKAKLEEIRQENDPEASVDNLKLLFSLIDLTSLNTGDRPSEIKELCRRVNDFPEHFPGVPNVGAVCIYPSLVPFAKQTLNAPGVVIASVSAGFPSSQTFLEVKEQESRLAVEAGAEEIDIVLSVGRFLEKDLEYIDYEISRIREVIGPVKLKVILETGLLPDPPHIYRASMASLEAGADFIKTSTGMIQPAATPEAVLVMCQAIKDHYKNSGRKAGIKPAGGISTAEQALYYAGIVRNVLGKDWLNPGLFRIGASRLANRMLSGIARLEQDHPEEVRYF